MRLIKNYLPLVKWLKGLRILEQNFISITSVKDISEIHSAKNIIKNSGEEFFTNFYVNDSLLIQWILRSQIYFYSSCNTLFILRLRKEFWHLYFLTNDLDIFSEELFCLTKKINSSISVDLVYPGGGQVKKLSHVSLNPNFRNMFP